MKLAKPHTGGIYIEFRDRRRRRKSESLTIEELTPKQALRLFVRLLRDDRRKAG